MYKKIALFITSIIALILILNSCENSHSKGKTDNDSTKVKPKVSVYYLHQKKRCPTCKAVGNVSKTTTEIDFSKEIKEGNVAYFDIDISGHNNDSIAQKFQCTWSGLYILSVKENKENIVDLTKFGFMYSLNKPDTLVQKIRSVITENL